MGRSGQCRLPPIPATRGELVTSLGDTAVEMPETC